METVRAFNRFYTRRIGVLGAGLLGTRFPLPQARILFELGRRERTDAAALRRDLGLDAGYLSRLLSGLEAEGLLRRTRSEADARRMEVRLTPAGRAAFAELDARSFEENARLLEGLAEPDQRRLLSAMRTLQEVLDGGGARGEPVLRDPRPGDLGWIVERHGALYAQEYGWDRTFEALVAEIVGGFGRRSDAGERAWIAELGGERAGSILCTRRDADIAQLRLLLVEPWARGAGVGGQLVDACVDFARRAGYATLTLWTNDVLHEARRLYERAGFTLTSQGAHRAFGHDLVEQTWELSLRGLTPE